MRVAWCHPRSTKTRANAERLLTAVFRDSNPLLHNLSEGTLHSFDWPPQTKARSMPNDCFLTGLRTPSKAPESLKFRRLPPSAFRLSAKLHKTRRSSLCKSFIAKGKKETTCPRVKPVVLQINAGE